MAVLGAAVSAGALSQAPDDLCCDSHACPAPAAPCAGSARTRLHQLDAHLHCSVIGTCLSTGELRKLMGRHVAVQGLSDLQLHHQAVSLAMDGAEVSKALHKALDQRHAAAIRRFSEASDEAALQAAWKQAWQQGEIPGAYWALLTHKAVSHALRQMAFGEVHMLSHLLGSANRHELRRFVALEKENLALEQRLERERARSQKSQHERDAMAEQMRRQSLQFEARLAQALARQAPEPAPGHMSQQVAQLVGVHTERREQAERSAEQALQQAGLLRTEAEQLHQRIALLSEELFAAEKALQQLSTDGGDDRPAEPPALQQALQGRRLLYVGGRPSSTPAIRHFVQRHGAQFLHHDGGHETRKGILAAQLPGADLVVFPVDCVDHDSVLNLKRLCERHGVPFLALRTASLASFAATVLRQFEPPAPDRSSHFCLRHG